MIDTRHGNENRNFNRGRSNFRQDRPGGERRTRSYSPLDPHPRPARSYGSADATLLSSSEPRHSYAPKTASGHGRPGGFAKKRFGGRDHKRNKPISRANAPMRRVTSENALRKEHHVPAIEPDVVRVIPLGGVEEVGKNMTAVEYGDDIVIVDAGIQFKTQNTPGIDYILPNTKYLEQRKHKIRGLVITHGHLDHIGAIPFIMEGLGNPPIYTREFGALLIKKRQSEFPHLPELNLKIVDEKAQFVPVSANLKIRFFGVTHSIPEATGIIIATPVGDIVFTGDVRIDNMNGVPTEEEIEQYAVFKDRPALMLLADSTGSEKHGWGISEEVVLNTIDTIVKNAPGRVIIGTFASQVERILGFLETAKKYGRKVIVEGRSMKNNVEIIKFLKLADTENIVPIEEMQNFPPHKILIIATGAQGDEFAALMRMSNDTHKYIKLNKTDLIILSSSVIPGNELAVAGLKDNLYRHDSRIITYADGDVHAGGHGKREELEWIQKRIPHRFFMPVHGQHYMLKMHAEIAVNAGMKREDVVVPDDGSIVEISEHGTKISVRKEKAPSGIVMVDGFSVGDVQDVVIRDRQALASDGMFVIVASLDTGTRQLKKSPDIISRGFVYLKESQDLLKHVRFIIKKTVEENAVGNPINFDIMKDMITDNVS
ncbi:ribonuclease J, partial [Patescibacteria group bacterium]|nr:ribonuclease J [Patescibacteria group bacterium]